MPPIPLDCVLTFYVDAEDRLAETERRTVFTHWNYIGMKTELAERVLALATPGALRSSRGRGAVQGHLPRLVDAAAELVVRAAGGRRRKCRRRCSSSSWTPVDDVGVAQAVWDLRVR